MSGYCVVVDFSGLHRYRGILEQTWRSVRAYELLPELFRMVS